LGYGTYAFEDPNAAPDNDPLAIFTITNFSADITDIFDVVNGVDIPATYALDPETIPILNPTVPEPSTWAMLLIGFAGIGFAGWRRARRFT
jgi:hypothetical protein